VEKNDGGQTLPEHTYQIRIEGMLGESWMSWFEGLTICPYESGETILSGRMDQTMLRGVLTKICDLGIVLLSVQRLEGDDPGA